MPEWLIPVSVFWMLISWYVGGAHLAFEGGLPVREVLALVLSFVIFVALWLVLRAAATQLLPAIAALVLSSVLALVTIPLQARLAFRLLGIRLRPAEPVPAGGHH